MDVESQSVYYTKIFPTSKAVYLAGEYSNFYPYAFVAKFSDPRFVSLKEEKQQEDNIHVFPNPTHNEINIRFDRSLAGAVSLKLFDQLGRVVASKECNEQGFSNVPMTVQAPGIKGVYILKANDGQKTYTEKVVVE
jgi:hypothetical protein